MSDVRGGIVKSSATAIQQGGNSSGGANSPRSPVKLEDYANIRRPVKPVQVPAKKDANQNADTAHDGKSPFQQELEGALRERKKRGLVTGFSDSENSVDGGEKDNNNVVNSDYLQKVDQNDNNNQWYQQQPNGRRNDSILFNNSEDVSLQLHSEDDYDVDDERGDGERYANGDGRSNRRRHDSLDEFEQLEDHAMNHCSQNSAGLGNVLEEESIEEDASGYGSRRSVIRNSDVADASGLSSGDILHLDDTEGSGLMNESEMREQGILLDDDDEPSDEEEDFHSNNDDGLPSEDPDLVMKMYMEPSPRPPDYPEQEYSDQFEDSDEDYISALQKASVDDIARVVAEGNMSYEDEEESLPSGYSQERVHKEYRHDNRAKGHGSDYEHQEYNLQSKTSKQSYLDDHSESSEEDGSPELGNTVVEAGNLNAAISAAATKVENFVDEPEMESDATSVSLGQFVPNSVRRTRLPPPGQRRASLKGARRRSSADLQTDNPNSASKKPSPRTTQRRSKQNSPRSQSASHVSSPRGSVRSNSEYSERSHRSRVSARSNSVYSEKSQRDLLSDDDYLNGIDLRETSPTLMSVYLNERGGGFNNFERPDGVPALDFGNSINSNISFLPRDEEHNRHAEEFAEQLQMDYDALLAKYAQAENTIDQLRLGAKVNLFGDEPVPSQAVQNSFSMAKQPQVSQVGQPQTASMQHIINIVNTTHRSVGGEPTTTTTPHTPYIPALQSTQEGAKQRSHSAGGGGNDDQLRFPDEASSGGKAMALMFQAKELQEEVDAFETLLKENHLTPPEQKTAYDHLKVSQEKLETDYMQAKEEDNAMRRRNSVFNNDNSDTFDPERAVEGQIFQIGMKLDDMNGIVMENLRNQPVELTRAPSRQEMFPSEINNRPPGTEHHVQDERLQRQGHQASSSIPVLSRRQESPSPPPEEEHSTSFDDPGDEDHVPDDVKEEEEEEDSPSPPFSPPSSPEPATMYNGHSKDRKKHHLKQPASLTSSSPEFFRRPSQQSSKIQPRRQSSLANNHHSSTSPRTGSSDHLDNGGARHKSPEMDMEDSGFMGSESSRQSNQTRPFGYKKRPGIVDNTRTNRRTGSRIPQGQRLNKGQKPSQESPVHSAEVVSESEEEKEKIITQVPVVVKKHNKHGTTPRKNGSQKAITEQHNPPVKSITPKLKHTPPHQSTPPSSKRHQSHSSQPTASSLVSEKNDPTPGKNPPPHQSLREPHQYQHESDRGDGGRDGLKDEYFVPSSRLSSAARPLSNKPAGQRSTSNRPGSNRPASNRSFSNRSTSYRPSSTKTLPHRTAPSTTYDDSGSEITRSSARSEALRALQDQIDEMKKQLADKSRPQQEEGYHEQSFNHSINGITPERERSKYGRPQRRESEVSRYGRPDVRQGSDTGSRNEALQMLREELDEVKEQLRQKQSSPPLSHKDLPPSSNVRTPSRHHQSTPFRDSLHDTLRSQYIPQSSPLRDSNTRTALPQSPLRQTVRSHIGQETPYRSMLPPKLHPSDLDHSPPPLGRPHGGGGGGTTPYVSTRNEQCPMCGGGGAHTHGQYQHAVHTPHQAPPQSQPQPTMYSPMQTQPSGLTYAQAPPVVTSTPIVNPVAHHQTLHQSYAPPPTLPQSVPGPQYVAHSGTQPAYAMSVPSQPAAVHIRDEPTPVVLVTPSSSSSSRRNKSRYYTREESSNSSNDDDVELYYRRTPRSSSRSSSRTPRSSNNRASRNIGGILKKTLQHHSEVQYEHDDGLDRSLESAVQMAQRLKRASKRMLTSVRSNVSRVEGRREDSFY